MSSVSFPSWGAAVFLGCLAACQSPEIFPLPEEAVCGDGSVDGEEQCDDGNLTAGDGCSANCTPESRCGDGKRDAGEICDDGNEDSGDGCSADCSSDESCGNGLLDPAEACDAGPDNSD
ncbi:DUF4215 domain-containing protein, partial [Endomicrobium sp. AH-315-J14]|nr:DUF4215 domain-containing protein [Endomicrobium sp. AH-315-J14]